MTNVSATPERGAPVGARSTGSRARPVPSLRHLHELSGPFGLFEHALGREPRRGNGYCTDDNGRALALACRLPGDPFAEELALLSLGFLERAHTGGCHFRLRLGPGGDWTPDPPSDDATGRALLGLGVAAVSAPWGTVRERAASLFAAAACFRSSWPRAGAYATIAAAMVARAGAVGRQLRLDARDLLLAGATQIGSQPNARPSLAEWAWPEARLAYANALLPAACLAAGEALGREELVATGLTWLAWLIATESLDGHFSFTPVGGRGPGGPKPAWDQQPIEPAAMAYACSLALRVSGDARWEVPLGEAVDWWLGLNDSGVLMWDPESGGGYDGLLREGVNTNEGAESTIAFVSAMVLAQAQAARASSRSETEAVAAPT